MIKYLFINKPLGDEQEGISKLAIYSAKRIRHLNRREHWLNERLTFIEYEDHNINSYDPFDMGYPELDLDDE